MKKAVCILLTALTVSTVITGCGKTAFAKENPALEDNFDAEFYAEKYPDVVAALGTSEAKLYEHYLTYGRSENRQPNASGTRTAGNTASAKPKNGSNRKGTYYEKNIPATVINAHQEFLRYEYVSQAEIDAVNAGYGTNPYAGAAACGLPFVEVTPEDEIRFHEEWVALGCPVFHWQ